METRIINGVYAHAVISQDQLEIVLMTNGMAIIRVDQGLVELSTVVNARELLNALQSVIIKESKRESK